MRRAALRETLRALAPEEAARLCGEIVRRGPSGAPWDVALVALTALLDAGELEYERHGELYAAARGLGDEALARLLLSAQLPPPGRPQRPPIPGRPDITLGERKSLARMPITRELLDRLLFDPDPQVIALLLGNPRLTESDVVRMAARRPTNPEVQRTIFRSERFITRYEVKRALALNPFTPSDLATRLVPLLTLRDLKQVGEEPSLAPPVRQAAREQLLRKR